MQTPTAVVVDDEPAVRELVGHCLRTAGAKVLLAPGANEGLDLLRRQHVDVLFTDLCLPTLDGITLLREAVKLQPNLAAVIMTGYASIESSVEGLRLGICDYVTKPITQEKIRSALSRALRARNSKPLAGPAPTPKSKCPMDEFVAQSAAMCEILKLVSIAAPTTAPVLIEGEIGVGKGLIARTIHYQSTRVNGPFVHVNCEAFSPDQLQGELCGYEVTSHGSGEQQNGLFDRARSGTLFLDHVDKLSLSMQAGLLDCLQEGRFNRVGGQGSVPIDVRVVSATTCDVHEQVAAQRFHRGLRDHLTVVHLRVPPLRHRADDLRPLVKFFLGQFRRPTTRPGDESTMRLSHQAWDRLHHHHWPGNVRELANVVEHAILMTEGEEIGIEALPDSVLTRGQIETSEKLSVPLLGDIKAIERNVIQEVIERCRGNKAAAARALGMHRRTLYRKLAVQT